MISRDKLAEMLKSANVEALAEASGVASKTIYRLRHRSNYPNFQTVEKLLNGFRKLEAQQAATAADRQAAA